MKFKKGKPDPLDPNDPRVLVEWTDKLGQTVRPGDYVVTRGYRALCVGKVLSINALRRDGKPFAQPGPQIEIHWCSQAPGLNKVGDLLYGQARGAWNAQTFQYDPPAPGTPDPPITSTERHGAADVIKIDWTP